MLRCAVRNVAFRPAVGMFFGGKSKGVEEQCLTIKIFVIQGYSPFITLLLYYFSPFLPNQIPFRLLSAISEALMYPRATARTMRSAMLRAPSLVNSLLRWVSTVFSDMNSIAAISFDV